MWGGVVWGCPFLKVKAETGDWLCVQPCFSRARSGAQLTERCGHWQSLCLSALSLARLLLLAPGSPHLQLCLSPRSRLTLTLCIQLRPVHGRHQVSLQTIPETERHSLTAVPPMCPMSGLPLPVGCPLLPYPLCLPQNTDQPEGFHCLVWLLGLKQIHFGKRYLKQGNWPSSK